MKGNICSVLILTVLLVLIGIGMISALPEPSITVFPNSLSPNSSFVMIVDPMTTQTPIRMAWSVYNPNMDGNYIMGQLPKINGKGICYFSNTDKNATCGPTPFMGTGQMLVEAFITASDEQGRQQYVNGSKVVELGDIVLNGEPYLKEGNKNIVLLAYYMTQSQVDNILYSVYDENMKILSGLNDRPTQFNTTPTPGFYAELSLPSGIYYISSVARKGEDYGGKMDRITIPKIDLLTLSCCKNEFYFGEDINLSGLSGDDSVQIKIYYPNGSIAKSTTVGVADEEFLYIFRPDTSWPDGDYNVTVQSGDLLKYKVITLSRLVKATPSKIKKIVASGSDFSENISLKNTGQESVTMTVTTSGGIYSGDVNLDTSTLGAGDTAAMSITIDSVMEDILGSVFIECDGTVTEIPIVITTPEGGAVDCPPCPPSEGIGAFSVSPVSWSGGYVVDEEASLSLRMTNEHNQTLDGFSYEFTSDYSSDNSDLSYAAFSPPLDTLSIDVGDSENTEFSFIPEYTGTYTGKLKISTSEGSSFIILNLEVFGNVSEEIDTERQNIQLYEDELGYDLYSELENYISSAESDVSVGNYKEAKEELEKLRAVRSILSNYGSSLDGGSSDCPPCNCASAGGDLTMIIIIVVIVIIIVGGAGAFIYLRSRAVGSEGPEQEAYEEDNYGDEEEAPEEY